MPAESTRIAWNWGIFAVVLAAVVAKNASPGLFVQTEELLLLPADERGQTTPIEIGWPIQLLYTQAFAFDFEWTPFGKPASISRRVIGLTFDVAVAALLAYTATLYLSLALSRCGWRFNMRSLLAGVAVIATLLVIDMRNWEWRGGVGAITWTMFQGVEAVVLVGIATTWYWLLTAAGNVFSRVAKRREDATFVP